MRVSRKATGFTLMETALAIMLLMAGMLGLTGVFSQITKSNAVIKQKRTAAFLATTKLAELRTLPLTEISELTGGFNKSFSDYSWQAQLRYWPESENIADIYMQVMHKSGTNVKLWTQVAIENVQSQN